MTKTLSHTSCNFEFSVRKKKLFKTKPRSFMSKFRVNVSECDGIKAFRVFIGFKVNKHIRLQIPDGPIPIQCHGYNYKAALPGQRTPTFKGNSIQFIFINIC